ncbi:MAG: hypothetical protein JST22_12795 [Bacteroidetes bacterium]|nr:hypothetical protein [Bacteroidota bacterium]
MRKITTVVIVCFFAACSGLLAKNVEKFTTLGIDGCKDWIILHDDDGMCRTWVRNCGEKAYHADPCGWEDCGNIRISGTPTDWTEYPVNLTSDNGVIYAVAPGAGGYYVPGGTPASCGGYGEWTFVADGSNAVTMSSAMVQLSGLQ